MKTYEAYIDLDWDDERGLRDACAKCGGTNLSVYFGDGEKLRIACHVCNAVGGLELIGEVSDE